MILRDMLYTILIRTNRRIYIVKTPQKVEDILEKLKKQL